MVTEIGRQVGYGVLNAAMRPYPYPHIYVPDVFPADYYAQIRANLPPSEAMRTLEEARGVRGYKERFVLDIGRPSQALPPPLAEFWGDLRAWLLGGEFMSLMLARFQPYVNRRFEGAGPIQFFDESLLVEDHTNYALGPHTDAPSKVITVLFYLPKDDSQAQLGTSLYVPKQAGRRCPGGPHHDRAEFDRVATMPFLPNSMFAFVKSDSTFHGVERVAEADVRRWLLLYDIKARRAPPPPPEPPP